MPGEATSAGEGTVVGTAPAPGTTAERRTVTVGAGAGPAAAPERHDGAAVIDEGRIAELDDSTCRALDPAAALADGRDPADFLWPSAAGPAPIPGSTALLDDPAGPDIAPRFDLRRVGDDGSIALVTVRPVGADATFEVVVGRMDDETRTFERLAVLEDCAALGEADADADAVWFAALGSARNDAVVEVDLATGQRRWAWRTPPGTSWLRADGDVVRIANGGDHRSGVPWGVVTLERGSGAPVGSVAIEPQDPEQVADATDDLWYLARVGDTGLEYRRVDPETGERILTVEATSRVEANGREVRPTWSAVLGDSLWWTIGADLQRVSLTDGALTTHPLGTHPDFRTRGAGGPSGIWVLSPGGVDGTTATLAHVGPDGRDVVTTTFPLAVDLLRRDPAESVVSELDVNALGFTYRDRRDGGGEVGPAPTWSYAGGPVASGAAP